MSRKIPNGLSILNLLFNIKRDKREFSPKILLWGPRNENVLGKRPDSGIEYYLIFLANELVLAFAERNFRTKFDESWSKIETSKSEDI